MKKIFIIAFLLHVDLVILSAPIGFQPVSTQPLLFNLKDDTLMGFSFELESFYTKMYDPTHMVEALILDDKHTLIFDQQGNGDFNPRWINLLSNNGQADYYSHVTFTPQMSRGGVLLHGYSESKDLFLDVRTALVEMTTKISIEEQGGGNGGGVPGIINALEAFSQEDWNYGKMGQAIQVFGLDDIQIKIGTKFKAKMFNIDLFGLIEAPTGTGFLSHWHFEPLVGSNHWGLGFGIESMVNVATDLNLFFGANYRYLFKAWETRSFDLTANGEWSRYMLLQPTYSIPGGDLTQGIPAINYLTLEALIEGRNQFNVYCSLGKKIGKEGSFKIGYNYFYNQAETIHKTAQIFPGYGIYYVPDPTGGTGGNSTASTATINEAVTLPDQQPVEITQDMINLISGSIGSASSNRFIASLHRVTDTVIYGVGISLDVGLSTGAPAIWTALADFEYKFGK